MTPRERRDIRYIVGVAVAAVVILLIYIGYSYGGFAPRWMQPGDLYELR